MEVTQWLRLALSERPNRVGVPHSPEEGNRSRFRNVGFSSFSNTGRWTKSKSPVILSIIHHRHRSQWPRGQSHELSSPALILGSSVRVPLETWMSMCVYSVFLMSCVQVPALRRADPPSKEFYRLCKKIKKLKSGQGPTKGCKAIYRYTPPSEFFRTNCDTFRVI
jgi:hypothetical protein